MYEVESRGKMFYISQIFTCGQVSKLVLYWVLLFYTHWLWNWFVAWDAGGESMLSVSAIKCNLSKRERERERGVCVPVCRRGNTEISVSGSSGNVEREMVNSSHHTEYSY